MRTNLLFSTIIIAAAFLLTQTLAAQNTPYWSREGNSNASASSKLGTTNAIPLKLFTNNVPRIYLDATGNIGIGTTAPAHKLHVVGNTFVSGNVGIGATSFSSRLMVNSSWNISPFSAQISGETKLYAGANGGLSVGNGSTPPINGLYVVGNVGIGTTAPTQKLHVAGNSYITGNSFVAGNTGIGTTAPAQKLHVEGNTYVAGNIGIGTTAPAQKLHVEGNTYVAGNIGIGTLTFSSKIVTNSTLNESPFCAQIEDKNVLYVGSNGGLSVGGGSTTPANGLYVVGNVGIGTASPAQKLHINGNTYVSGNSYVDGNVGIGTATPAQKLHVEGNSLFSGHTYLLGNVGVGTTNPSYKLEVQGGSSTAMAGFSSSTAVYGKGGAIGVYGSGTTYGIYAGSTSGYGAYLYSAGGTGLYAATGRGDKNYAGVFQGNVHATGLYTSSDKELKQNIEEMDGAMSLINRLKPKHYEFRQDGKYAALNLPQGKHYGLIAQELEEVLPSLVKEAPLPLMEPPAEPIAGEGKTPTEATAGRGIGEETINVKAVNYTELIPILVKALQEQDQKIEQQQQQINELKTLVSRLSKGENISTSLSSAELLQNIPNPVRGSTSISYSLPEGAGRSQMIVTDALGRTIKTLDLSRSGVVQIDVSTLSSGIYHYSLVVASKVVQTRKMTVEK